MPSFAIKLWVHILPASKGYKSSASFLFCQLAGCSSFDSLHIVHLLPVCCPLQSCLSSASTVYNISPAVLFISASTCSMLSPAVLFILCQYSMLSPAVLFISASTVCYLLQSCLSLPVQYTISCSLVYLLPVFWLLQST